MKTPKIVGTALLGAAFAVAGAGAASAAVVPGLPDPVGQLTSPLESVTGAQAGGDVDTRNVQAPSLGQLGAVTGALPVGVPL